MKNIKVLYVLVLLVFLLIILMLGCKLWSNDIVQTISIFKAQSQDYSPPPPPPPGGWTSKATGSHPTKMQGTFDRDDKMYLGLVFDKSIDDEINLSRFTFFNKETGNEENVAVLPSDLGPFEPGRTYLLGFENPWTVPNEEGEYELRLYLDDDMVASAIFVVH